MLWIKKKYSWYFPFLLFDYLVQVKDAFPCRERFYKMQRPTKKEVNNKLYVLRMFVSAWDRGWGSLLKMATTVTCFSHVCTRSWSVTGNPGLSCQQQTAFSRVKGSTPDNLLKVLFLARKTCLTLWNCEIHSFLYHVFFNLKTGSTKINNISQRIKYYL